MLHPNSPFYVTHPHEAPGLGAGFDFLFNEYIIDDLNKLWISIAGCQDRFLSYLSSKAYLLRNTGREYAPSWHGHMQSTD